MSKIVESIDVDVPVRVAYDQWTQFEEFPRFMDGVKQVTQLNDTTLEWSADINGVDKSWQAEIIEQEPDRVVAWRSTTGARNDGRVSFEPIGGERSRATLELDVEPDDPIEKAGDALGFVKRQVEGDLKRFKEFIESRGTPTGGWRGEVEGGRKVSG